MVSANIKRSTIRVIVPVILTLVLQSPQSLQANRRVITDDVGFVVRMAGDWYLGGRTKTKVLLGQSLPSGGQLRGTPAPGVDSLTITVCFANGKARTYECNSSKPCDFELPSIEDVKPTSTLWSRITDAVRGIFGSEPERYAVTISRGAFLQDSVLELRDERVDLSAMLVGLKSSRYFVQLRPLGSGDTAPPPAPVDSQAGRPAYLYSTGLRPGLYRISLLEAHAASHEPLGISGWALIKDPRDFKAAAESFQHAIALTAAWSKQVDANATQSFLRAYLQALANQR